MYRDLISLEHGARMDERLERRAIRQAGITARKIDDAMAGESSIGVRLKSGLTQGTMD